LVQLDYVRALMVDGEIAELADLCHRPAWQRLAACRGTDPNVFVVSVGQSTAAARAVCATCAVSEACLDYALSDPDLTGVWGGTSGRQRQKMRKAGTTTVPTTRSA